jgi:hypothetical protein
MKRLLIAATVAVVLSVGCIILLSIFSVSMIRLLSQSQNAGVRLTSTEALGVQVARLWDDYTPFAGAVVIAACFGVSYGVTHLFGRKADRPAG